MKLGAVPRTCQYCGHHGHEAHDANGAWCQSEAMYEWDRISDRDSYDETSATLDAYTPGESK